MDGKFVAYFRVSRKSQGESGLGLEAQERAVTAYLNGGSWELLEAYVEVESGKRDDNRPELQKALNHCRMTGATLLIAKLDRLSRNSAFVNNLLESTVLFKACDMPDADPFIIRVHAALGQKEREQISQRTKDGLASIKVKLANGQEHVSKRSGRPVTALGGFRGVNVDGSSGRTSQTARADAFAKRVAPMLTIMRDNGASLAKIAETLNSKGVVTPRGCEWTPMAVKRALDRLTQDAPQSA